MRSCQAGVCGVAYAILRDRARSEECAQEAFLVAWRQRTDPRAATAAWICGIARNLARNAARRRQEQPMTHEPSADERDARDALIARDTEARALAALATLPERYREAVVLYYRADESIADVAAALGCTADTARQRVHRGRTKLREAIAAVETTLRATRPGHAFTAACVAAWTTKAATAEAASASAVATSSTLPAWLAPALAAVALGVAAIVGVASGAFERSAEVVATGSAPASSSGAATYAPSSGQLASSLRARFPRPPTLHRAPSGFHALPAGATPAPSSTLAAHTVDLDFRQAPMSFLVQMLAVSLDTPMWLDPALDIPVDIEARQRGALDVLDQLLDDAGGIRTEVPALRLVVTGGRTDAATLGGDTMSVQVKDAPLDAVLSMIEPRLHMPIGRLALPNTRGGVSVDGEPYEDPSPTVTLDVIDRPAGEVLERVLTQSGLRFELTTGFALTPEPS